MDDDDHSQTRRALSPDARLLSRLSEIHVGELENELAHLCGEEAALIANGGHAAALALPPPIAIPTAEEDALNCLRISIKPRRLVQRGRRSTAEQAVSWIRKVV